VIPPRYLYPVTTFEAFQQAYVRFLKASALATTLGLTGGEMAHFGTHPDYRINAQGHTDSNGHGWLNALPNADNLNLAEPGATVARTLNATLLTPLRDLLDYARIKPAISPGDELLLTVLRNPTASLANGDSLLLTLARWDKTSLDELLSHFGGNIAGLTHFDQFRRVYDAFAVLRKMGLSAGALTRATTNEPVGDTVRDLQGALRARYDSGAWRDLVQPINDAMRSLQRDALVAYILHQMRSNRATEHINTPDKLFEYFLMDVQMEPCMQTSRIRHALSSVQLFIERCLMNIEPRVSSTSIDAKQWEWRKRYRVWEANRKVFLFPENWLEPELRDDKSPFFKEVESELLQSDITEESATKALLTYLSKLEEVARLEPCGIYHLPADPAAQTSELDHVIARTAGGKYYYRRYEFGYWTPWEQVNLDIEDNPVIPVLWKGRLLLFWLRILKQAPVDPKALPGSPQITALSSLEPVSTGSVAKAQGSKPIADLSLGDIKSDAKNAAQQSLKVTAQAVLCWSEYYNGKWQPAKTSDMNHPVELDRFDPAGPNAFNRSDLRLSVDEEGDILRISVWGAGQASFLLYNTHSRPVATEPIIIDFLSGKSRDVNTSDNQLVVNYTTWSPERPATFLPRPVLTNDLIGSIITPTNPHTNAWDAPFFYEDTRHVFLVRTTELLVPIHACPGYGLMVDPIFTPFVRIPPLIFQFEPPGIIGPKFPGNGNPNRFDPGAINSAAIRRFVTEDANIRVGLGTTGGVTYGGSQIGPSGSIQRIPILG
ncbi:MAG TPA: neuraminidase-like domain-containing protein, partial [Blastocatellia bacterium]|nr:neuraminidase-like domain-containing protein [Blastocatellia bacterium]